MRMTGKPTSSAKWIALVGTAVLLFAAGCASDRKSQHAIATEQWNGARASVMYGLARDQYQNGNFDKANQTLAEAMRLEPTSAKLHVLAGKLAIEHGDLEVAERELASARQFDPKDAEADYLSGVVCQRWQKAQTAYAFYDLAITLAPNEPSYLLAKAEMLVSMDRADEALSVLQDKTIYFEHSAVIRDAVGQLLVQKKRYAEAVDVLREASILDTNDLPIREHLAMALYFNKNYREASDLFTRLLTEPANKKRTDLYLARGDCQLQLHQPAEARGNFETASQLSPSSLAALTSLARAALELNDLRRADLALRNAITLDPQNGESQLLFGYLRLRQNNLPDALTAFQKANSMDAKDTVSLCMIGYVLERSGQSHQAKECYGSALKLNPLDELAHQLMASVNPNE